MNISDEIERLQKMKDSGALSEEEFEKAKKKILDESMPNSANAGQSAPGIPLNVNSWAMFLHLSQFCGYIVPLAGLIVPIVLWQMKKDESPVIDRHGRIVLNWIISAIIYWVISVLLCFIIIGFALLFVMGVLSVVFPIIGAVKANNGEVWKYPCSIKFFGVDEYETSRYTATGV